MFCRAWKFGSLQQTDCVVPNQILQHRIITPNQVSTLDRQYSCNQKRDQCINILSCTHRTQTHPYHSGRIPINIRERLAATIAESKSTLQILWCVAEICRDATGVTQRSTADIDTLIVRELLDDLARYKVSFGRVHIESDSSTLQYRIAVA